MECSPGPCWSWGLTGLECLPDAPAKGRRLGGEDVLRLNRGVLFVVCGRDPVRCAVGCASAVGRKRGAPSRCLAGSRAARRMRALSQ
jgi:hypothetical protein